MHTSQSNLGLFKIMEHIIHNLTIYMHIYIYIAIFPSEKERAPHSSTPAWKIPWLEEPGRLQSMGSLRLGHD